MKNSHINASSNSYSSNCFFTYQFSFSNHHSTNHALISIIEKNLKGSRQWKDSLWSLSWLSEGIWYCWSWHSSLWARALWNKRKTFKVIQNISLKEPSTLQLTMIYQKPFPQTWCASRLCARIPPTFPNIHQRLAQQNNILTYITLQVILTSYMLK